MRRNKSTRLALTLGLICGIFPIIASPSQATTGNYLVMFKEQPDPSKVATSDITLRREALYEMAVDTASRTQGGVLAYLRAQEDQGTAQDVKCFIIVNACAFKGEKSLADYLATRSDVHSVSVDEAVKTNLLDPGSEQKLWHIDRIKAREAWTAGYDGAGVVIGSIDTGVSSHEALSSKRRSTHSWFDAWGGASEPFDDNGHGTHTLGTAIGGDGTTSVGDSEIGVAPAAKWMAAKGFGSDGRGLTSNVLLAMQWMQFPTDPNVNSGQVDPSKAPNVVSNSWSVDTLGTGIPGGCRPWYSVALKMWRNANILPVFSSGDGGGAPRAPADLPEAFTVGASDALDRRASFSTEGNACEPITIKKPDIHAPGVTIHSSYLNNTYATKSGTSMAAPQVAGAVALLLDSANVSGSPTSQIPVSQTVEAIKSSGDTCTDSSLCRPRLNIMKAIAALEGGFIAGRVTKTENNLPVGIAGAQVTAIHSNGFQQTAVTDNAGNYRLGLVKGSYTLSARAYGFITKTELAVPVNAGQTTQRDFLLSPALRKVTVRGSLTYFGSRDPAEGGTVRLLDTPRTASVKADGTYEFLDVPDPSNDSSPDPRGFDYAAEFVGNPCSVPATRRFTVPDSTSIVTLADPILDNKTDDFGYSCVHMPLNWQGGTSPLSLRADDGAVGIALPFAFPLYENQIVGSGVTSENTAFETAYISVDGNIRFDGVGTEFGNTAIPTRQAPNAAIYAFWDDLDMDASSQILTSSTSDTFTVEWRDMIFNVLTSARVTFSATLHRHGDVEIRFKSGFDPNSFGSAAGGSSATIGLENRKGTRAFTYSFDQATVRDGLQIAFTSSASPTDLRGKVSGPSAEGSVGGLAGATVAATGGGITRTTTTYPDGSYRLRLPGATANGTSASYSVTASKWHYYSKTRSITLQYGSQPTPPTGPNWLDFVLDRQPGYTVSGKVKDATNGVGLASVPVTLGDANIPPVESNLTGDYIFNDVPSRSEPYRVTTMGSGRCRPNVSSDAFTLSGSRSIDVAMTSIKDGFGYGCEDSVEMSATDWIEIDPTDPGATVHFAASPTLDTGSEARPMPFDFPIYGKLVTEGTSTSNCIVGGAVNASIDGHVTFSQRDGSCRTVFGAPSSQPLNKAVPTSQLPNLAIFALWDDLVLESDSRLMSYHQDGSNSLVIEWKNFSLYADRSKRVSVELVLFQNGNFDVRYLTGNAADGTSGNSATIGLENLEGNTGYQYSFNQSAVSAGLWIRFQHPSNSTPGGGNLTGVLGKVTASREDGTPLGTPVDHVDIVVANGVVTRTAFTDAKGEYTVYAPPGNYTLYASKNGYRSVQLPVTVPAMGFARLDFTLQQLRRFTLDGRVHDRRGPLNGIGGFQFDIRDDLGRVVDCAPEDAARDYCVTESTGDYAVTLYEGRYSLVINGSGKCQTPSTISILLDRNLTQNLNVALREGSFGYTCLEKHQAPLIGLTPLAIAGSGPAPLALPFEFPIYGHKSRVLLVYPNGVIKVQTGSPSGAAVGVGEGLVPLDLGEGPVGPTLHVLDRSDLIMDGLAQILWANFGVETAVVEWRNMLIRGTTLRITFSALIDAKGDITYQYEPIATLSAGSAVIGISCNASNNFYYAQNDPSVQLRRGLGVFITRRFPSSPQVCQS